MLDLNDPLWGKLDDGYGNIGGTQTTIARLAASWDDETAKSLFYDSLVHQETCGGATYAVIPHLLKIAEPEENRHQRREIAFFLGYVVLCARDPPYKSPSELQGLPETLEGWDHKRDCYRSLVASLEQPDRRRSEYVLTALPRYREILAIEPVNAADLEKILSIKAGFYSVLPAVRTLCERALLENDDEEAASHFLSGIAAADGLLNLARLLHCEREGCFNCALCGSKHEFILFGERIAVYALDPAQTAFRYGDTYPSLSDYKEGAPSRADGFMAPIAENDIHDARITALLSIAEHAARPDLALRVRHFAGTFRCCKCGVHGPIQAT